MADEQTVVIEQPPVIDSSTDQLTGLSYPEYQDYMKTGKLPEAKPEESPSSPAVETPKAEEPKTPAAAAPETAKTEKIETGRAKTERRFRELLAEKKQAETRNQELERELAELRKGKSPAETVTAPAAEKTEPKTEVKAEPSKAVSKLSERLAKASEDLKAGKYATYEDYIIDVGKITAEETFTEKQERLKAEAEVAKAKEESDKSEKAKKAATEEFEKARTEVMKHWAASVTEARKLHDDFDEVFTKDLPVPPEGLVETCLLTSPVGTEIAYHFGKNPEELKAINGMPPHQAALMLARLELKYTPQSAPATPEKKETKAPPPVRELGGGATAPKDEIDRAVRDGDVDGYIREANRRDLQRSKRG